jgi:LemA protein
MRGLAIVALVILLLLVAVGGSLAGTYNRLVQASQQVDQSWANVETQYQRRFDLIPNLVEATKGFLQQERVIFGEIAEARTRYAGARTPSERVQAANQLEGALARLLVIVENYPVLRSSETVQRLMAELAGTENEIAFARRAYNQAVLQYNTLVKTFPTNLVAGFLGFRERPFFQAQAGAERAPRIDLTIPQQTRP